VWQSDPFAFPEFDLGIGIDDLYRIPRVMPRFQLIEGRLARSFELREQHDEFQERPLAFHQHFPARRDERLGAV
jgi:hypothetical protein